jgi:23S rRNA pseudouridine1911/1915/1917 synthase
MKHPKGEQWAVAEADVGLRLDKFLAAEERLGSRRRVAMAIETGRVFLNEVEAVRAASATRLSAGDVVRVWMDRPGSAQRRVPKTLGDLRILYEDESFMVVDKPAGLLSVPLERKSGADSVYHAIQDHWRSQGKRRPFVVHRIDRDTSGLVVLAKSAGAQQRLKDQFRRREPERVYWAVVYGHPKPAEGTWRDRLVWDRSALIQKATHPGDPQGTDAISEYRTVERFQNTSLIEVRLKTGRRNQIRIQARLRGHTLVGERRYTYGPDALRSVTFARQALHARRLSFVHPVDGRAMTFEAELPADLTDLIRRLRKDGSIESG